MYHMCNLIVQKGPQAKKWSRQESNAGGDVNGTMIVKYMIDMQLHVDFDYTSW